MRKYRAAEVKAVLAMFSAFGIDIKVEHSDPNKPMIIHTKLFQRKNGEYCDQAEENVQD
jgi:hypothetical protein